MHDDIIDITITDRRKIKNEFPIRKIYEYEEDTEDLIINSKPIKEEEEGRESKTEV